MDAARRRYLEQLVEMGEREFILSHRPAGAVRAALEGETPSPVPADNAASPPTAAPSSGPSMYPRGLVIEAPPPRADLFTHDPIAASGSLGELARLVAACTKCALHAGRTNTVPGEGNPRAGLVCVGEAPGQTEDETGRPFVGRAGKLLTDILRAIGLAREEVFICNVLKCRPPDNRTPQPLEAAACSPYLHRQLELVRPKVILALGKPAATTLLQSNASLGDLRGKVHRYRGIPLVVTYHPAALLRNPNWKPATWDDVRIARRILDGEAF
jgi:uracil-DNA glycosylase family 4